MSQDEIEEASTIGLDTRMAKPATSLTDLADDLIVQILSELTLKDLITAQMTCRRLLALGFRVKCLRNLVLTDKKLMAINKHYTEVQKISFLPLMTKDKLVTFTPQASLSHLDIFIRKASNMQRYMDLLCGRMGGRRVNKQLLKSDSANSRRPSALSKSSEGSSVLQPLKSVDDIIRDVNKQYEHEIQKQTETPNADTPSATQAEQERALVKAMSSDLQTTTKGDSQDTTCTDQGMIKSTSELMSASNISLDPETGKKVKKQRIVKRVVKKVVHKHTRSIDKIADLETPTTTNTAVIIPDKNNENKKVVVRTVVMTIKKKKQQSDDLLSAILMQNSLPDIPEDKTEGDDKDGTTIKTSMLSPTTRTSISNVRRKSSILKHERSYSGTLGQKQPTLTHLSLRILKYDVSILKCVPQILRKNLISLCLSGIDKDSLPIMQELTSLRELEVSPMSESQSLRILPPIPSLQVLRIVTQMFDMLDVPAFLSNFPNLVELTIDTTNTKPYLSDIYGIDALAATYKRFEEWRKEMLGDDTTDDLSSSETYNNSTEEGSEKTSRHHRTSKTSPKEITSAATTQIDEDQRPLENVPKSEQKVSNSARPSEQAKLTIQDIEAFLQSILQQEGFIEMSQHRTRLLHPLGMCLRSAYQQLKSFTIYSETPVPQNIVNLVAAATPNLQKLTITGTFSKFTGFNRAAFPIGLHHIPNTNNIKNIDNVNPLFRYLSPTVTTISLPNLALDASSLIFIAQNFPQLTSLTISSIPPPKEALSAYRILCAKLPSVTLNVRYFSVQRPCLISPNRLAEILPKAVAIDLHGPYMCGPLYIQEKDVYNFQNNEVVPATLDRNVHLSVNTRCKSMTIKCPDAVSLRLLEIFVHFPNLEVLITQRAGVITQVPFPIDIAYEKLFQNLHYLEMRYTIDSVEDISHFLTDIFPRMQSLKCLVISTAMTEEDEFVELDMYQNKSREGTDDTSESSESTAEQLTYSVSDSFEGLTLVHREKRIMVSGLRYLQFETQQSRALHFLNMLCNDFSFPALRSFRYEIYDDTMISAENIKFNLDMPALETLYLVGLFDSLDLQGSNVNKIKIMGVVRKTGDIKLPKYCAPDILYI